MSQLLCEQVVGRGLRRASYELGPDGKFTEEVSQVFGVPFEVIPFKANPQGPAKRREKRYHVHALPGKTQFEISFPRVEGYTQAIRNRVTVDWANVPPLVLVPGRIPPEVEMKGLSVNNAGKTVTQRAGRDQRGNAGGVSRQTESAGTDFRPGANADQELRGPTEVRGSRPRVVSAGRQNLAALYGGKGPRPPARRHQGSVSGSLLRLAGGDSGGSHQTGHFTGRGGGGSADTKRAAGRAQPRKSISGQAASRARS